MNAVILEKPGSFRMASLDSMGRPGPNEAVVRVRRVGVCGTDLHAFRGRQPFFAYPRILGHELGVEILEAGPNDAGSKRATGARLSLICTVAAAWPVAGARPIAALT